MAYSPRHTITSWRIVPSVKSVNNLQLTLCKQYWCQEHEHPKGVWHSMWLCVTQMCVCPSATTIILKKRKKKNKHKTKRKMNSAGDGHSSFM